jgi:hypothetical protein
MNNMEHEDKREAVNRELQLRFKGYATNKTGTRVINVDVNVWLTVILYQLYYVRH